MILHLVGGFLGSGKTTAIIAAARHLLAASQRVGVVTNDQGRYLVDTAFFQTQQVPTVEVTGGCFCCHYDDLEERLEELDRSALPHVIFAGRSAQQRDRPQEVHRLKQDIAVEHETSHGIILQLIPTGNHLGLVGQTEVPPVFEQLYLR